jgi:hypothetical protein
MTTSGTAVFPRGSDRAVVLQVRRGILETRRDLRGQPHPGELKQAGRQVREVIPAILALLPAQGASMSARLAHASGTSWHPGCHPRHDHRCCHMTDLDQRHTRGRTRRGRVLGLHVGDRLVQVGHGVRQRQVAGVVVRLQFAMAEPDRPDSFLDLQRLRIGSAQGCDMPRSRHPTRKMSRQ